MQETKKQLAQLYQEIEKNAIDFLPNRLHNDDFDFLNSWVQRKKFTSQYSWAIPEEKAIHKLVEFIGQDKCLEVGAGSGLWSKLLELNGVDIVATDIGNEKFTKSFTIIKTLSAQEAVKTYKDRNVLFLCWSRVDPTQEFTGDKIIYIGEEEGGCTNGIPDESIWKRVGEVSIPQWEGIHDAIYLYKRK